MTDRAAPRVRHHQGDDGWWEMTYAEPAPALRPYVRHYLGYREEMGRPLRRREYAHPFLVLIIDFGPTLRLLDPVSGAVVARHPAGFIAGLGERYTLTETAGAQSGIQVDFTPLGAHLFLGLPLAELTGQVVGLDELWGTAGSRLTAMLHDAPDWSARFALLDRTIGERIAAAAAVPSGIAWAWQRLQASKGQIEIGELTSTLDVSRKHLVAQFRHYIGLPPKRLARVLRFNNALALIEDKLAGGWAEIAAAGGYYDQAHLIREFRAFTGDAPSAFLRRRLPEGGGFQGD